MNWYDVFVVIDDIVIYTLRMVIPCSLPFIDGLNAPDCKPGVFFYCLFICVDIL